MPNMKHLAPIALFVYKRPEHTKQTIESLLNNSLASESELFIFSDGPKSSADSQNVSEVRSLIDSLKGFKKVTVIKRQDNWGLAKSIIKGVTDIVGEFGSVIVIEDDLVLSPFFLDYMNRALAEYENDESVMHISGYMFPLKLKLPETFFYNQASCWGWATWARAWRYFNPDAAKLLKEIRRRKSEKKFNIDGQANLLQQLIRNAEGQLATWAVKWEASVFLKSGLCLHPGRSLVKNIGFDGTGTNSRVQARFDTGTADSPIQISRLPLQENTEIRTAMKKFYQSQKPTILNRLKNKIKSLTYAR